MTYKRKGSVCQRITGITGCLILQKHLDKNHGNRYPKIKERSRDDLIGVMSLVEKMKNLIKVLVLKGTLSKTENLTEKT